ncbi:hypothetical protein V2A60_002721 [Cordyceps javanica]
MTNAKCTAYCFEKGFVYAGTEYSSECYCGNWLARGAKPAQVGECSDACAGDGTEACGGRLRLTLYKTNKLEAPEVSPGAGDWESMGCYTEGIGGRALESQVFSIPTENMTAQLCMNACEDQGFALSGVEYAGECYCGNELKNYARATVSDGCDMTCKGNHGELCGGANRLNLYKNKLRYIAPPRPSATAPGTAMPSQCPGQPGQVEQDWDFAGCYTEAGNNLRALHAKSWSDDAMSLASCSRYCAGFTYFGVEYGRECYCGDGFQGASARTADAECSMLCPPGEGGLQCEYCGAGNRLSVYKNRKLAVVEPSSSSRSSSTLRPTTLATTVSKPTSTLSTATSVGTSSKSTQLTPSLSSSTAGLSSSSQSTLSLSSTITSGNHSVTVTSGPSTLSTSTAWNSSTVVTGSSSSIPVNTTSRTLTQNTSSVTSLVTGTNSTATASVTASTRLPSTPSSAPSPTTSATGITSNTTRSVSGTSTIPLTTGTNTNTTRAVSSSTRIPLTSGISSNGPSPSRVTIPLSTGSTNTTSSSTRTSIPFTTGPLSTGLSSFVPTATPIGWNSTASWSWNATSTRLPPSPSISNTAASTGIIGTTSRPASSAVLSTGAQTRPGGSTTTRSAPVPPYRNTTSGGVSTSEPSRTASGGSVISTPSAGFSTSLPVGTGTGVIVSSRTSSLPPFRNTTSTVTVAEPTTQSASSGSFSTTRLTGTGAPVTTSIGHLSTPPFTNTSSSIPLTSKTASIPGSVTTSHSLSSVNNATVTGSSTGMSTATIITVTATGSGPAHTVSSSLFFPNTTTTISGTYNTTTAAANTIP